MGRDFYTTAEIAGEVGLAVHTLVYWLRKWGVHETSRVGGAKVYDSRKLLEIKGMVKAAKAVNSFASTKCPVPAKVNNG